MLIADIWPFKETEAATDVATIPVSTLGRAIIPETVRSITSEKLDFSDIVPVSCTAGYAILLEQKDGLLDVYRLDATRGDWEPCARYESGPDSFRIALQCNTVLTEGIATDDDLEQRVNGLIRYDMKQNLIYQFLAMLTSVGSTILIFSSLRLGLGNYALDVFFLLLGFSALSVFISQHFKFVAEGIRNQAMSRINAQFMHEQRRKEESTNLTSAPVQRVFQKYETMAGEVTSFGSFAILLGFAFYILPSAALLTLIGSILAALILSIIQSTPQLDQVLGGLQLRVVQALIGLRNTANTRMIPGKILEIRRKLLWDQVGRYQKIQNRVKEETMTAAILNDLASSLCYVVIVGGFIIGFAYTGSARRGEFGGLSTVPIVEMAPLLILLSLAGTATRVAKALSRYRHAWTGRT